MFCSSVQKFKLFSTNAYTLTVTYGSVLLQENDEIRCAAIHLMGNLSKFGSGEPVFKDQIHNVLVSLLLHLVDPNPQVVKVQLETHTHFKTALLIVDKCLTCRANCCIAYTNMDFVFASVQACKFAMRVCAPVVGSEQITTMFQNHLHEDKSLHYGEFINDLTKYLVRHTQSNVGKKNVARLFFEV